MEGAPPFATAATCALTTAFSIITCTLAATSPLIGNYAFTATTLTAPSLSATSSAKP